MIRSLLEKHSSIKVDILDREGFRQAISSRRDSIIQLSTDGFRHLGSSLFVTFDKGTLDTVVLEIDEADRSGPDARKRVHLIAFLPMTDKETLEPGKLTFKPKRIVWYDPENPFKSDADVLESIREEFRDLILGKKHAEWK